MIGDHLKLVENVPEGAAFCFEVPEEYPVEDLSTVLLYEPEKAAKIFAQLCGYTLLDKSGRVVTGRMPGQEEQK